MITYIKIKNEFMALAETIYIDGVSDTPDNGLWLVDAGGLGEVTANIASTEYAIADGSFFNSSKVTKRNITLKFRLADSFGDVISNNQRVYNQPPKNIEQSRLRLYNMFPYKTPITISIKTNTYQYEKHIIGYVESVEPSIFNKKEQVDISLICPNPFFYTPIEVAIGAGCHVEYKGTSLTGFLANIDCGILDTSKDFSLYSRLESTGKEYELKVSMSKVLELVGGSISGGRIKISSITGNKYIKFSPALGDDISLMPALGIGPFGWNYLSNGTNYVTVKIDEVPVPDSGFPSEDIYVIDDGDEPSGFTTNEIILSYKESYGGV